MKDITMELNTKKVFYFEQGETFQFRMPNHDSVGITSEIKQSFFPKCVLESAQLKYFKQGEIMPGGDEGEVVYQFRATKTGKSKIRIKRLYRGDIQSNFSIKIVVSK